MANQIPWKRSNNALIIPEKWLYCSTVITKSKNKDRIMHNIIIDAIHANSYQVNIIIIINHVDSFIKIMGVINYLF